MILGEKEQNVNHQCIFCYFFKYVSKKNKMTIHTYEITTAIVPP